MHARLPAIFLLALAAATRGGAADTVVLRDGTIRQGTILSHDQSELRLQLDADGISGTISIPLKEISRVVYGITPPATAPGGADALVGPSRSYAPSTQPTPSHPNSALSTPHSELPAPADSVPTASDAELATFRSHGFLPELLAAGLGQGLDDPNRLPGAQRDLWDRAVQADAQGNKADTLDALRALEAAMQDLPDGLSRLNAIARRQRDQSFALWMGKIHWDLLAPKYSTGQFDLKDVRDIERPVLIGQLKLNTAPALEPLKPYFPPIDEKTGQPTAYRNSQLQGITPANALAVKDQALRAAAILLAQLKLEPAMPAIDRALLSGQLSTVNRILSRARDLEPLAKAALARAEQEKRIAEEKARREAAIAAQRKPK